MLFRSNDAPGPANEADQPLTILSGGFAQPAHGTVVLQGADVVYTPAADFHGTDSFTYTIHDVDRGATVVGTVTVAVIPVNDAPRPGGDAMSTAEDTPLAFTPADLLANDASGPANESHQDLTLVTDGFSSPDYGTLTVEDDQITYTPNADFNGTDQFTYTIHDGDPGSTAVGTVTMTVTPENDRPLPADDQLLGYEDTPLTVPLSALLDNDQPGPADEHTQTVTALIDSFTSPDNGTLAVAGGLLTYTPDPDFNGTDSFTYSVHDGELASTEEAQVSVTVKPVNDAAQAVDDAVTTTKDTPLVIDPAALLANDSAGPANEADQQLALVPAALGKPAHGKLLFSGSRLTYIPEPGFFGTDAFTYAVTDGLSRSAHSATVTVTVNAMTPPPAAAADTFAAEQDAEFAIPFAALLDNDDVDPALTLSVLPGGFSTPNHGTLRIEGGQLVYTPDAAFFGTDSFTYTVADSAGGTDTATVTVNVQFVLELHTGLDLFSVPVVPHQDSVAELFADLPGAQILAWNGTTYDAVHTIEPLTGYWFRYEPATRAETVRIPVAGNLPEVTARTLQPNWNLVGVARPMTRPNDPELRSEAYTWNPETQKYQWFEDDAQLRPGDACWFFAASQTVVDLGGPAVVRRGAEDRGGPTGETSIVAQDAGQKVVVAVERDAHAEGHVQDRGDRNRAEDADHDPDLVLDRHQGERAAQHLPRHHARQRNDPHRRHRRQEGRDRRRQRAPHVRQDRLHARGTQRQVRLHLLAIGTHRGEETLQRDDVGPHAVAEDHPRDRHQIPRVVQRFRAYREAEEDRHHQQRAREDRRQRREEERTYAYPRTLQRVDVGHHHHQRYPAYIQCRIVPLEDDAEEQADQGQLHRHPYHRYGQLTVQAQ